jgi:Raf kinase inhibitor-like YbhB/YbcL family protein
MKWPNFLTVYTVLSMLTMGNTLYADLKLQSSSFNNHGFIPKKNACDKDGSNRSPGLIWTGAPVGVKSYAIICYDQLSPKNEFVHWIIFNIPATVNQLPEGVAKTANLPNGARQGKNSFKNIGFDGPCPPPGTPHLYHFVLYALDEPLSLAEGTSLDMLKHSMEGHILDKAELVGLFEVKENS